MIKFTSRFQGVYAAQGVGSATVLESKDISVRLVNAFSILSFFSPNFCFLFFYGRLFRCFFVIFKHLVNVSYQDYVQKRCQTLQRMITAPLFDDKTSHFVQARLISTVGSVTGLQSNGISVRLVDGYSVLTFPPFLFSFFFLFFYGRLFRCFFFIIKHLANESYQEYVQHYCKW